MSAAIEGRPSPLLLACLLLDRLIRLPRRVITANLLLLLHLMHLEVVIHLRAATLLVEVTMPLVGATIKITAMGTKIKEHPIMDMVTKTPAPLRQEAMAFPTFLLLVAQARGLAVLPNLLRHLADNPVPLLSGPIVVPVEAAVT